MLDGGLSASYRLAGSALIILATHHENPQLLKKLSPSRLRISEILFLYRAVYSSHSNEEPRADLPGIKWQFIEIISAEQGVEMARQSANQPLQEITYLNFLEFLSF